MGKSAKEIRKELMSKTTPEKINQFGISFGETVINIRSEDTVLDIRYTKIARSYLDDETLVLYMGDSTIRLFNEVLTVTY